MIKILHKDYNRVLKIKKKRVVGSSSTSGFNKPVKIRKELADFTGWDVEKEYSRIDVTRFICNSIKEKNLQNPEDRRLILPDEKLAKVLRYDPKTATEPLTYFRIQMYVQWLFIKEEKPEGEQKVHKPRAKKVVKKEEKEEKDEKGVEEKPKTKTKKSKE